MSLSPINGNRNAGTIFTDDDPSKMEDHGQSSPVTAVGVVPFLDKCAPGKDNDDGSTCPADVKKTKCQEGNPTDSITDIAALTPVQCGDLRGDDSEGDTSPTNQLEIQLNGEIVSSITSSTIHEHSKTQTEETRILFAEMAVDTDMDLFLRSFADTAADILEWWQIYADNKSPNTHHIDFRVGPPLTLLHVLALLPEGYQSLISIQDEHRSPSRDGENLSWLHEQTIDVLLQLSIDPDAPSIRYGHGLASMIRDDVDAGWRTFTGRSWLEDQIHLCSNDNLESDLYRFPPGTDNIVFFFNPTETHWTVVEIDLDDQTWTYTLYNSLSQDEKGATWKACLEQFPLLERLICRASQFPEPATREIVTANSAQQTNEYDCGPIALYNAIELLQGRKPSTDVDADELRLRYLKIILDALYLLDEDVELPIFRDCMRQAYLDSPM